MTGEGERHDRTGRPEVDDLLDIADVEQRALDDIGAVNSAENIATDARHAELVAAHAALYRRVTDAEAARESAEAAGDAAAYAAARLAFETALAEFNRLGPELIAEAQVLMAGRLQRTDVRLAQMDAAWKASDAAMEALTGRRRGVAPPPATGDPNLD